MGFNKEGTGTVSVRLLPQIGTPEYEELKRDYPTASREQLEKWAIKYKYANLQSFKEAVRRREGIFRASGANAYGAFAEPITEKEPPIINLPAVQLQTYEPVKVGKGDPETQVLLLGDHHAGEITPTYNPDIYKKRMNKIFESTMIITELHRNMYPIEDLVIIMGGDMVHGENPYQGATVETIVCGAQTQIFEIALPELLNLILSFKQEFKTITIHCIRGNHGRYSRFAPRTSNWDIILYKALKGLLVKYDISMTIPNDFNNIFLIQGFKFFAFHGDQIQAHQGIPYFAMDRKVSKWFVTYGGFNYSLCFHFHKDDYYRLSAKTKGFINGALVSDDPFTQEVIGTSTIPTQWTFGVHQRTGISFAYTLNIDKKFLPEKMEV